MNINIKLQTPISIFKDNTGEGETNLFVVSYNDKDLFVLSESQIEEGDSSKRPLSLFSIYLHRYELGDDMTKFKTEEEIRQEILQQKSQT